MSRRTVFLIICGVITLLMVIPMFLSGRSLSVKFVLAGLSAFVVFFSLGSMWLIGERDEARNRQSQLPASKEAGMKA